MGSLGRRSEGLLDTLTVAFGPLDCLSIQLVNKLGQLDGRSCRVHRETCRSALNRFHRLGAGCAGEAEAVAGVLGSDRAMSGLYPKRCLFVQSGHYFSKRAAN